MRRGLTRETRVTLIKLLGYLCTRVCNFFQTKNNSALRYRDGALAAYAVKIWLFE
jgi:hypothetical protein